MPAQENGIPFEVDENHPRFKSEVKAEEKELKVEDVMSLPKQGNFRLTKDFLQVMDSDCEEYEELDDDFVLQAMQSGGEEYDEGDEGEDEGDEDEGDAEDDDNNQGVAPSAERKTRGIDEEFDRLMLQEYDDDDVGDLGEYYETNPQSMTGPLGVETHQDYLDEFATRKDRNYQPGVDNAVEFDAVPEITEQIGNLSVFKPKPVPVTTKTDLKISQKVIEEQLVRLTDNPEDIKNIEKEIMEMKVPVVRNQWDCESIVSTYSNLENHPTIIKAPRRDVSKHIQLSKKTGIPVGYYPTREAKDAIEEEDEGEGDSDEEEDAVDKGAKRPKQETKEEKKARKAAIKESRRQNRNRKKDLRNTYKVEGIRQATNDVNQKTKNPAGMRLD